MVKAAVVDAVLAGCFRQRIIVTGCPAQIVGVNLVPINDLILIIIIDRVV